MRRGGTVVAAALVPAGLVGWLLWQGLDGSGGTAGPTATDDDARPTTSSSAGQDEPGEAPSETSGPTDRPLKGKTIVIDPGHNPNNRDHTAEIARRVDIGTGRKECDTTGTATNSGYTEAEFTLDLAHRLRTHLEEAGAKVRLTQDGDREYGPCIDERAEIGNKAKADAVVSLHADGSGEGNRGFHVILPGKVKEGAANTNPILSPSRTLGEHIAKGFARTTGSAASNYIGDGKGLDTREDLGGLNLSKVPKVFLECGNMRDPKDEALLTSKDWREKAADGIAAGITGFLNR